jgi:hypothetical protein
MTTPRLCKYRFRGSVLSIARSTVDKYRENLGALHFLLFRSPHSFVCTERMDDSSIDKIRDELQRLLRENLEKLETQVFVGITPEGLRQQKERLERIREVSADFLEALTRTLP